MNILLTGATGFVGQALTKQLLHQPGVRLTLALRTARTDLRAHSVVAGNLTADTDFRAALAGQQVVIHAAARAHVMKDEVADPLAEYRRVNVAGT